MPGYPWNRIKNPLALPAGMLRQQIKLQSQTAAPDSFGQPQQVWTTFLTVFAHIATMSMREVFQAQQFVSQVTHRVTLRWPGSSIAIVPGQRVVFGTHMYVIQGVENVEERNRVLHLMVQEINGASS